MLSLLTYGSDNIDLRESLTKSSESSSFFKQGYLQILNNGQVILRSAQGFFLIDVQNKKSNFLVGRGGRILDDVVTAFNQTVSLAHSYDEGHRNNLIKFETSPSKKIKVPREIRNYQGSMRLAGDSLRLLVVSNDFLYIFTADTWRKIDIALADNLNIDQINLLWLIDGNLHLSYETRHTHKNIRYIDLADGSIKESKELNLQSNFVDYMYTDQAVWYLYSYAHYGTNSSHLIKYDTNKKLYDSLNKTETTYITSIFADKENLYLYNPERGILVLDTDANLNALYNNWPKGFVVKSFIKTGPDSWLLLPSRGTSLILFNGKTRQVSKINIAKII